MYRVFALVLFGLSSFLLTTDATMAVAMPASALVSMSGLLLSMPSALAVVLAALGRKLWNHRPSLPEDIIEDYYAPLMRMVRILDRKDAHDRMLLGQ